MKVAVYIRVNQKSQLKDPEAACMHYCMKKDYEIFNVYNDACSGVNEERPGFTKLMNDRNNFEKLIIPTIQTLSRNAFQTVRMRRQLEDAGIGIEILEYPPTDKLIDSLSQSFLEEIERDYILVPKDK